MYRMIPLQQRDGLTNTVLDEVFERSLDNPTIAFSTWETTISIGRAQDLYKDVDVEKARNSGVQIIRRKSGGRTVYLDDGHLGFTIITPTEKRKINISKEYETVCSKISEALEYIGIKNTKFANKNDILANNKKIGNAAMINRNNYTLIHGSIFYEFKDFDEMLSLLKIDNIPLLPYKDEAREVVTTVKEESSATEKELYNSLITNLCPNSNVTTLTMEEISRMTSLKGYYSNPDWIERGKWSNENEPKNLQSRGPCDFIFDKKLMIPQLKNKMEKEGRRFF